MGARTMMGARAIVSGRATAVLRVVFRSLVGRSGEWDAQLTRSLKKDIEAFWKDEASRRVTPAASVSAAATAATAATASADPESQKKNKMYVLAMFPYPSGNLHLGHVRVYTIGDMLARYHSMLGRNVLYPIGWDSFGLPAENAAIERGEDPKRWTENNIADMTRQLRELNFSFDWDRELSTCDPAFYRWTQFLLVKLFDRGLLYRKRAVVNWDPVDNTTLADEQVDANGRSWRSGAKVEKRLLHQWFVRTTEYSRELYRGLDGLQDWDDIVGMQKGWIGDIDAGTLLSFTLHADGGAELPFERLDVWTDTPELIPAGASFVVVGKDHLLADIVRKGVRLFVENPFAEAGTRTRIPVFVDSNEFDMPKVTQTLVAVPSCSEAHADFAKRNGIEFVNVLDGDEVINSGRFNGPRQEVRRKILEFAKERNIGGFPSSRSLRDWLISRQRYWGTPIPIIHCDSCGPVAVPVDDLPVLLPALAKGSKLVDAHDWVRTSCPKCSKPAKRETDTMDTFVDSSWYFMRYLDPKNTSQLVDPAVASQMMPVDIYIGGVEHAVMHLYYARFMSLFMHKELGLGNPDHREPFKRMVVQGMVVNETFQIKSTGQYISKSQVDLSDPKHPKTVDGALPVLVEWDKMSKSKHNGIMPREVTDQHGIDTTRLFILGGFGPTSRFKWPSPAFSGICGWQDKLWTAVGNFRESRDVAKDNLNPEHELSCRRGRNEFLVNVKFYLEVSHQFDLVIKALQIFTKVLRSGLRSPNTFLGPEYERALGDLIICLVPVCPHLAAEMWAGFFDKVRYRGVFREGGVFVQRWPQLDKDHPLTLSVMEQENELFKVNLPQDVFAQLTKERAQEIIASKLPVELREAEPVFNWVPLFKAVLIYPVSGRGKRAGRSNKTIKKIIAAKKQ